MKTIDQVTTAIDNDLKRSVVPDADIHETNEAFVLSMDLPGASKESINVSIDKDVLQVKATVANHLGENAKLLHRELKPGEYQRAFKLGDGIDTGKIDATFENGVLTMKLLKSEAAKPKIVQIN